jgi:hypothetical protein
MLFAGDALAVIDGKVRCMSRPVTPDLVAARKSMERCLERDIQHLCPRHRDPLSSETAARCRESLEYLRGGGPWSLFG